MLAAMCDANQPSHSSSCWARTWNTQKVEKNNAEPNPYLHMEANVSSNHEYVHCCSARRYSACCHYVAVAWQYRCTAHACTSVVEQQDCCRCTYTAVLKPRSLFMVRAANARLVRSMWLNITHCKAQMT
jgi:hypothetical protein